MDWFLYDSDLRHERVNVIYISVAEAHLGHCQTSVVELFVKIVFR